jgi:glycosyltransferase involved in cell wall biosynthesis
MSVSVVLATHNEAQNLERCLQSVAGLADEIIVVDGASTDATAALAKKCGAQVIETTNKANFHINKQIAMDKATGKLVLQLDADEVIAQELSHFIARLKSQLLAGTLPKQPVAWFIRRKNHLFGRWLSKGGQYPDAVIRLYLSGKARLPQKNVHEQMVVDGEIATAAGHILHYSYPTFSEYVRKFNTYTSFAAGQLQETAQTSQKSPSMWNYFLVKPLVTFFSLYLRHRGYVDGMPGFVFALMSSLHHPFVYLKYWEYIEK